MADPVLDEDYILALLRLPVTADNGQGLQAGAVQALCDLYDRKTTRQEFQEGAGACLVLYTSAAKFMFLERMRYAHKEEMLTEVQFAEAHKEFEDLIRTQAANVVEIVKRLQLCPTSQDKVH